MQGTMEAILNEVKKVVTGKDDAVLKVMLAITAGGHILIDDIPLVWERPPWRWGLPRRWDTDVTEYSSHLMSCLRI